MQAGDHGHMGHVGPVRTYASRSMYTHSTYLKREMRETYTHNNTLASTNIYSTTHMHGPCMHAQQAASFAY